MFGKNPVVFTMAVLVVVSVALAGCGGKSTPTTSPTPSMTTGSPTPTTNSSAPAKPAPGQAEKRDITFSTSAPSAPKFTVSTAWTKLTFTYWLNSTSACFVLANEPPAGAGTGPAPELLFTSKASQKIDFSLGSQNSCTQSTTGGQIATAMKDGTGELGDWTVTVHGIGQNVKLTYLVTGS